MQLVHISNSNWNNKVYNIQVISLIVMNGRRFSKNGCFNAFWWKLKFLKPCTHTHTHTYMYVISQLFWIVRLSKKRSRVSENK